MSTALQRLKDAAQDDSDSSVLVKSSDLTKAIAVIENAQYVRLAWWSGFVPRKDERLAEVSEFINRLGGAYNALTAGQP